MSAADNAPTVSEEDVERYLLKYNYAKALSALRAEKQGQPSATATTTTLNDFARANAPTAAIRKDDKLLLDWRTKVDSTGWVEGLRGLAEFVHSSLDLHRPELLPILLPILVHTYLDLVGNSNVDLARRVLAEFQGQFEATHRPLLNHLASLGSAEQLNFSDEITRNQLDLSEQIMRWKTERYHVRMTPRGKGLLLGWLQSGSMASGRHADAETKGRDKITQVLNRSIVIDELQPGTPVTPFDHGFEDDLLQPRASGTLPIGVPPVDAKLAREAVRVYNEKAKDPLTEDAVNADIKPDLAAPSKERLPPAPATMRQVDIEREVGKLKEARKRIRLGPEAFAVDQGTISKGTSAKPSVCLFTVHDARETLVSSTISEDATLLACGFSESYIRLWDTRGPKLAATRSDYDPASIKNPSDLKLLKDKTTATQTRKLIGHGGPVYSLAFDPTVGAAQQPRWLLSGSQDSTVRLWSLDTYSAVVSYRGHRDPVWDIDWSARGTYFASASRDRTARVWSTERTSPLRIMAGHLSDVDVVRFHPNTLYLGTASSDQTCRLWDVQTGHCVRVFSGHTGAISSLAFSPDGRYLASAGDDMHVNLWDIGSGRIVKSMAGHTARVDSLTFNLESNMLVSAAADNTVRFWDVSGTASMKDGLASGGTETAPLRQSLQQTLEKSSATIGVLPKSAAFAQATEPESTVCRDLLCTLLTKRTPVQHLRFTQRNLCLAVGPFVPESTV